MSAPLRPSLHRANVSTNSLNQQEKFNRSALSMSSQHSTVSSNASTLMSSPPYHHKGITASEMFRTESADSHRSLKSKHSRKDLREMQRSASPMVSTSSSSTTTTSSSKHKYSRSWEDESNDDDARSISSFSCPFAAEFDSKHRDRSEYGEEENGSRQRFLDAVFRKLSQKTGLPQRESRAWAAMNKAIEEEKTQDATFSLKSVKVKPHFLDLSGYISPIPTGREPYSITNNVTPRPCDFQRFEPASTLLNSAEGGSMTKQRPLLRSRRSADTLGESRRLQREEWSAVALNSARGAATAESERSSLGLNVGQLSTPGMSHAMLARATNSTAPVPNLPDWARSNNRSISNNHFNNARQVDMARVGSHEIANRQAMRPVDMARAASHDATMLLNRPVRPNVNTRGVSGPVRGAAGLDQPKNIPANLQFRLKSPRSQPLPLSPLSPQWPRHNALMDDCTSPIGSKPPTHISRESVSSTTSDSGASSCISSVPQTPVTRSIGLPNAPLDFRYGDRDEIELTADDEDALLSGMGPYALEMSKRDEYKQYYRPNLPTVTPKSASRKGGHIATLFEDPTITPSRHYYHAAPHSHSSSSTAFPSSTEVDEEVGNTTVKANRVQRRPRASTLSSVGSPTRGRNGHTLSQERVVVPAIDQCPTSPNRSSSLPKRKTANKTRDSVASSLSSSTTTSSSSTSSHSESLLSYTKGSPSSSCISPTGSPSTSSNAAQATTTSYRAATITTSPRKSTHSTRAEDWASSIGKRFAKGALRSSPTMSTGQQVAELV